MNNLSSYCGLVDAKIRASDKDLPVKRVFPSSHFFPFSFDLVCTLCLFFSQTFEREVNKRTCNEFVECLVYSKSKAVVMTGNFTDSANPGMLNEIGIWHKPWFFKHVEEKLECNGLSTEFIPIRDYYHRHSRYFIN